MTPVGGCARAPDSGLRVHRGESHWGRVHGRGGATAPQIVPNTVPLELLQQIFAEHPLHMGSLPGTVYKFISAL